jgi:hypothetical protein
MEPYYYQRDPEPLYPFHRHSVFNKKKSEIPRKERKRLKALKNKVKRK